MANAVVVTLGTRIRQLREGAHLTQAELGDKLNVSDKTVRRWERDLFPPSRHHMTGLEEVLGRRIPDDLGEIVLISVIQDWRSATPPQVLAYLVAAVTGPAPTVEELQSLDDDSRSEYGVLDRTPQEMSALEASRSLLWRALLDRYSIEAWEAAGVYRKIHMAAEGRIHTRGVDRVAELRARWLDCIGRLAVELAQRSEEE